jgi:hypothetical protein
VSCTLWSTEERATLSEGHRKTLHVDTFCGPQELGTCVQVSIGDIHGWSFVALEREQALAVAREIIARFEDGS